MKRYLTMALVGVLALGLGSAAYAVECAVDAVPASTLLFPFVSYDYVQGAVDNSGQTTLFAITNVSSDAQIVHITVWTDYSVAILDFNLTLTGYDVQTINIRDILRDGILPSDDIGANEWEDGSGNGNAGGTPFDDGPYSTFNELWDGDLDTFFAANGLDTPEYTGGLNCNPATWVSSPINYRAENNGNIPAGTLDIFMGYLMSSQTAVTGYVGCDGVGPIWVAPEDFPNGTWFTNQDHRATWLYITADVVGACNKDLPDGSLGYFTTADGVLTQNVIMGDQIWLDSGNNFSEADNAVHLEAVDSATAANWTPSPVTGAPTSFYHRYHLGAGTSLREPLPTAWAFRYMLSEAASANTWVRAWKGGTESGIVVDLADSTTGSTIDGPGPAELYAATCIPYTYYTWDEDENVNAVGPGFEPPWSGGPTDEPIPVPNLFPLETQEVPISEFFIVQDTEGNGFGWMMVIWPLSNYDGSNPVIDEYDAYQTWMGVKYAAFGQYTSGFSAAVMANYNCDSGQTLGNGLGIGMYSYSE